MQKCVSAQGMKMQCHLVKKDFVYIAVYPHSYNGISSQGNEF